MFLFIYLFIKIQKILLEKSINLFLIEFEILFLIIIVQKFICSIKIVQKLFCK